MASVESLRALMTEIGPLLELGEVREYAEQGLWTLAFDEQTVIEVDYDATFHKAVIAAVVGNPPERVRAALYPLLLQYNYLWEKTGGARLALNGPEGEVVLACDVPVADLDLPRLQAVLGNAAACVWRWRELIQGLDGGPGPAPSVDELAGIRV